MRRVTDTNILFWANLTKHLLQGNIPLRHLLIAKILFMYWQRSASNEVNDWSLIESEDVICQSLFHIQQSTCVSLICLDIEGQYQSFEPLIEKMKKFYTDLDLHYRIVSVKAENLKLEESQRIEIQVWSPLNQRYITVGSLSKYGDFVSKRLHMKYYDSEKNLKSYNIMHCTLIDTFKVLGCLIENKTANK